MKNDFSGIVKQPDTLSGFEDISKYSQPVRKILRESPPEFLNKIKEKKFYHVTSSLFKDAVMEYGLKRNSHPVQDEDLRFLEDMYNKYSQYKDDDFFNYYIKRENSPNSDNSRAQYVSDFPNIKLYQVPESLKFFLANLNYLIKADLVNKEQAGQAQVIFDKYYDAIASSKTVVFEIDAVDPAILDQLFMGYDHLDPKDDRGLRILNLILDGNEPNMKVDNDISKSHIRVHSEEEIDMNALNSGIYEGRFIIF